MSAFVADASVAAKWFLREPDAPKAMDLLRTGAKVFAPAFLQVELAAAIVRRFRNGGLNIEDARERLIEAADAIAEPRISFFSDTELLPRASSVALDIRHPLQDCLYIACAERVQCDLITVDPKFLARAAPVFPFVRAL